MKIQLNEEERTLSLGEACMWWVHASSEEDGATKHLQSMVLLVVHVDGPAGERAHKEVPQQHRTVHNLQANASHHLPC